MRRLNRIKRKSWEIYDADLIVTTDGEILKCRYASPAQFKRVMVLDPNLDFIKGMTWGNA